MIEFNTEGFSKAIRVKLAADDITQDDVSKALEIATSTLSGYQNGRTPSMPNFVKILNWLEKDSNDFIKETNN